LQALRPVIVDVIKAGGKLLHLQVTASGCCIHLHLGLIMILQGSNLSEEGLLLLSSIVDEVNKRGCQLNSINLSGELLPPTSILLMLPPSLLCVRVVHCRQALPSNATMELSWHPCCGCRCCPTCVCPTRSSVMLASSSYLTSSYLSTNKPPSGLLNPHLT
jgi:hypothetical protein